MDKIAYNLNAIATHLSNFRVLFGGGVISSPENIQCVQSVKQIRMATYEDDRNNLYGDGKVVCEGFKKALDDKKVELASVEL
jgi:hypothetical protein